MPENQAIDFQKYIDRLDQDRKEAEKRSLALEQRLMDDAREREQRRQESEERSREERKAAEERSREERKAAEERSRALEERNREERKALEERLNANVARMEGKMDDFIAETKESIREIKATNRWFIGFNIALITGATTIIIAFINLLVNGSG